jgi:hypothetical protein
MRTALAIVVIVVVLAVVGMVLVDCRVEEALFIRNMTGRPIVVETGDTGASVRIKDGSVRTLPHSVRSLSIKQEGGGAWQYGSVEIYDFEDQVWHSSKWVFIPVRRLHIVVEPNGKLVVQPPKGKAQVVVRPSSEKLILPNTAGGANPQQKNTDERGK